VKGRLGIVLRSYLEVYLPHNAHELCDGNTFLAVTKGAGLNNSKVSLLLPTLLWLLYNP
jgi:hypothetical protein